MRNRQFQPGSTIGNGLSVRVQQPEAQGGKHACAAIVGGRAADADQEVPAARFQCIGNEFSHTAGGGMQRVPAVRGDQGQTGGRGHLQNCSAGCPSDAILCLYRIPQRAGDGAGDALLWGAEGSGGALAAVSQRGEPGFQLRADPSETGFDGTGGLQ